LIQAKRIVFVAAFPATGPRLHMPEELLVILGAEAALLVVVTAMTLRNGRMDILSGTIRLRLLKIAARVIRVRLAFAAACSDADLFRGLANALVPQAP
jgi:hypothetical protein